MSRAEREQQLLDIAEEVFAERGYLDATVEDIAGRAGITKPVIYDHFGSKDGLIGAVIDRSREQLLEATNAAWDALGPDAPVVEFFRVGVRTFMEYFEERRDSFRIYQLEATLSTTAFAGIEKVRQSQAEAIAVRLGKAPGLEDVPMVARLGMAEIAIAANERAVNWRLRNPEITMEMAIEIITKVLWGGFRGLLKEFHEA